MANGSSIAHRNHLRHIHIAATELNSTCCQFRPFDENGPLGKPRFTNEQGNRTEFLPPASAVFIVDQNSVWIVAVLFSAVTVTLFFFRRSTRHRAPHAKNGVFRKTRSTQRITTPPEENWSMATVNMRNFVKWIVWFLRYARWETHRQTDSKVVLLWYSSLSFTG